MKKVIKQLEHLISQCDDSIVSIKSKFCGELLGAGSFRNVYSLLQFPDYVIKIERDPSKGQFANVCEWRNYIDNQHRVGISKWLAPCVLINETGQVMIQERVSLNGKTKRDFPKRIPAIFTDIKRCNFGWIGGNFVCCDYSYLRIDKGNKTMVAKWRGELTWI